MSRSAFVTGASGFLGINLVQELKQQGWRVTALHRPTSNLKYLEPLDINLRVGTIEDLNSLMQAIPENTDVVFHMAASTNLWSKRNKQQFQTNVMGTQNVVKAALAKNTARFIHTSSVAAYGLHDFAINEQTPSTALDSGINYFVTKYLAEEEVKKATSLGLDAVIINPAHIVGPFDTQNWVQMFQNIYREQLPGVPEALGKFTYAPEVARAHIQAVDHGIKGENYLLAGVEASMLQFVNAIEMEMGKPIRKKTTPAWLLRLITKWYQISALFSDREPLLTPEKTKLLTHNVLCDDRKAREQLGFKAVPLEAMVKQTFRWLEQEQIL